MAQEKKKKTLPPWQCRGNVVCSLHFDSDLNHTLRLMQSVIPLILLVSRFFYMLANLCLVLKVGI